jgi:hypothetical protein
MRSTDVSNGSEVKEQSLEMFHKLLVGKLSNLKQEEVWKNNRTASCILNDVYWDFYY